MSLAVVLCRNIVVHSNDRLSIGVSEKPASWNISDHFTALGFIVQLVVEHATLLIRS
jgi:hypothetical protein